MSACSLEASCSLKSFFGILEDLIFFILGLAAMPLIEPSLFVSLVKFPMILVCGGVHPGEFDIGSLLLYVFCVNFCCLCC